jgi:hypothetical protein
MGFLGRLFGSRASDPRADRTEPVLGSSDKWSFGPFSLSAMCGLTYISGQAPAVYASPTGVTALISVYVLDGTPPPEQARVITSNAKTHVRDVFVSSAERFGVSGELIERPLPSGDLLLSWPVIETAKPDSEYLIQNAVLSPVGNLAIITVEGKGAVDGVEQMVEVSLESARFAV